MGSPSSLIWQPPPKLAHSELMACDVPMMAPVVLSKTPKPVLTICTNCVAPTAPLVSGGAQLQKLGKSLACVPRPEKLSPTVAETAGPAVVWATGSGSSAPAAWPGVRSGRSGEPRYPVACADRSRTAGDTPCCTDAVTSGFRPDAEA